MNFYYSMSRKSFFDKFSIIVAASDSIFITGRYFYYNKEMGYYCNILGSDEEPYLLHYIVDSANRMGFQTLQEGVETEEHYHFLKAVDCVKAQGYYFGKPQPLAETRAFTEGKGMKWEKTEGIDGIL